MSSRYPFKAWWVYVLAGCMVVGVVWGIWNG